MLNGCWDEGISGSLDKCIHDMDKQKSDSTSVHRPPDGRPVDPSGPKREPNWREADGAIMAAAGQGPRPVGRERAAGV